MNKIIKRFWRWPLSGIAVATIVLAMGVLTARSMNTAQSNKTQEPARRASVSNETNKHFTTRFVAGQQVQIDGQTGQIRPLTPEEAKKLADGIKELVNQSSEGLVPVKHPDGSVSIDLQGRFQSLAVAKKADAGTVTQSCVDNTQAAAEFFGISHQLFEKQTKSGSTGKNASDPGQPTTRAAAGKGELK